MHKIYLDIDFSTIMDLLVTSSFVVFCGKILRKKCKTSKTTRQGDISGLDTTYGFKSILRIPKNITALSKIVLKTLE